MVPSYLVRWCALFLQLGTRSRRWEAVRQKELATRNRNANGNANGETARQAGDDIAERLLDIAAAVIWLLPALGDKPGGKNLMSQLERCGPGGGANYEEARGAESPADFVHKVRIALKEVRETRYWLRLIELIRIGVRVPVPSC